MKLVAPSAAIFILSAALPAYAADVARMEQVIQTDVADNKFMGAVLVAQGDTILLDKGYGSANLEWDIPNRPSTRA
jgi:CubicO group peptidase (beta-lactamase class C family)